MRDRALSSVHVWKNRKLVFHKTLIIIFQIYSKHFFLYLNSSAYVLPWVNFTNPLARSENVLVPLHSDYQQD
jgi:hypothetical protein